MPTTSQHDTQRTLRILVSEGKHLSWLIQTILDVSRIEAGRLQPRLGPVALGPLLAEACAATLAGEPEAGRIGSWSRKACRLRWADETLLGEVVRNLIENAMRYSQTGTPVEVAARYDGDGLVISVTDHGYGVPSEEQERIFRVLPSCLRWRQTTSRVPD